MGYTSAYNRHVPPTFDILPTSAGGDLLGIVMAVCRVSPNASLETATAQSLSAVAAMRLTRETPIVKVTADGKTVEIRQEALTNLQQNLSEKGLYRGPLNGVSSPALVAAIKAIQTREKLEVTGLPDIDTMIRAILKK
jgi:peptidoglycan hydrolase-like protein with peptidoglycan-binding domain